MLTSNQWWILQQFLILGSKHPFLLIFSFGTFYHSNMIRARNKKFATSIALIQSTYTSKCTWKTKIWTLVVVEEETSLLIVVQWINCENTKKYLSGFS